MNPFRCSFPLSFIVLTYGLVGGSYLWNDVWPIALAVNFRPQLIVFILLLSTLMYVLDQPVESLAIGVLLLVVSAYWAGTVFPGFDCYHLRGETVQWGGLIPV